MENERSADVVIFSIRCPRELKEAADTAAQANDETVSRVIRRALREYVAANRQAELPLGGGAVVRKVSASARKNAAPAKKAPKTQRGQN